LLRHQDETGYESVQEHAAIKPNVTHSELRSAPIARAIGAEFTSESSLQRSNDAGTASANGKMHYIRLWPPADDKYVTTKLSHLEPVMEGTITVGQSRWTVIGSGALQPPIGLE
jgi:hypothetical protein